jgi:hypothetical protein
MCIFTIFLSNKYQPDRPNKRLDKPACYLFVNQLAIYSLKYFCIKVEIVWHKLHTKCLIENFGDIEFKRELCLYGVLYKIPQILISFKGTYTSIKYFLQFFAGPVTRDF